MRYVLTLLAFVTLPACSDFDLGGGVSGSILGSDFSSVAGSAESSGFGYTITLSDTGAFECSSFESLPDFYLTVVLDDVREPMSIPAAGRVTFNSFEDDVITSESADSGQIVIESVDPELGTISGSIDATGATSSVAGSFTVDICR
ncbi:MAG: hypothetical protein R3E66_07435 [bacterium]